MDMRTTNERLADSLLISVITTCFLTVIVWWLIPTEDENNFSVTIDCRAVLLNPSKFPEKISGECETKLRLIVPDVQRETPNNNSASKSV